MISRLLCWHCPLQLPLNTRRLFGFRSKQIQLQRTTIPPHLANYFTSMSHTGSTCSAQMKLCLQHHASMTVGEKDLSVSWQLDFCRIKLVLAEEGWPSRGAPKAALLGQEKGANEVAHLLKSKQNLRWKLNYSVRNGMNRREDFWREQ